VTLRDKPVFKAVGQAFLDFVADAKIVAHNASFDVKFLNAELRWMGLPEIGWERAVDTLAIARKKFPGSPASLDALCRRFGIDSSARTLHGALLDSEILAEVYLELMGGQQPDFALSVGPATAEPGARPRQLPKRPHALASRLTQQEAEAHAALVADLGETAIWNRYL
jgi:DNA polymerase-3 subunit epsilon